MKKLSNVRVSVKMQAVLTAVAMAFLLGGHLLDDNSVLGGVLNIAAMLLVLLPFFMKRDVQDELAVQNHMKSMRVTLGVCYVLLLCGSMLDFSNTSVQFTRLFFQIALCGLLLLQSILIAYFESKGGSFESEDE